MGDRQDVIRNPKYIILTDSILFGPSMDGAMPILLLGSQSHQQMPRHESGLINNHDTSALASASAAAMYATRRNPLTNDSPIACRMFAWTSSLASSGIFMLTKSALRPRSCARTSEDAGSPLRRSVKLLSKVLSIKSPKTATASSAAIRETALFMPEATPAWRSSTAPITVVVSGATLVVIPMLITITAGKKLVQ